MPAFQLFRTAVLPVSVGTTGTYESIASISVGSGNATTLTFSSIPQTYAHLELRLFARQASGTGEAFGKLNFNNDSGANKYWALHQLYSTGSSAVANAPDGLQTYMQTGYFPTSSAATGQFGACVLSIYDYTSTNKNKAVRSFSGFDLNGAATSFVLLRSGMWQSTAAITQIDLTISNGVYAQFTHAALYGIRG